MRILSGQPWSTCLIAALFTLGACGESTDPDTASLAGAYDASLFTRTTGGTTTDELANGATVLMLLTTGGTTNGQLFIPDGNGPGVDFTADLAGTYTLSGNTVTFQQGADTFIRNMTFQVAGSTLVGDQTFSGTRIRLTLTRR